MDLNTKDPPTHGALPSHRRRTRPTGPLVERCLACEAEGVATLWSVHSVHFKATPPNAYLICHFLTLPPPRQGKDGYISNK